MSFPGLSAIPSIPRRASNGISVAIGWKPLRST